MSFFQSELNFKAETPALKSSPEGGACHARRYKDSKTSRSHNVLLRLRRARHLHRERSASATEARAEDTEVWTLSNEAVHAAVEHATRRGSDEAGRARGKHNAHARGGGGTPEMGVAEREYVPATRHAKRRHMMN